MNLQDCCEDSDAGAVPLECRRYRRTLPGANSLVEEEIWR